MSREEIGKFAIDTLRHYGYKDWGFSFIKHKRTVGLCDYQNKTIHYSIHYLNRPLEKIKETILHEIAHVLAGPFTAHGPKWIEKCNILGIEPNVIIKDAVLPKGKFSANCSCGNIVERYNESRNLNKFLCSICSEPLIFVRNKK